MTTPNSRAGLELFWFNIPGAQRNFVNKFNKPHSHHAPAAITAITGSLHHDDGQRSGDLVGQEST